MKIGVVFPQTEIGADPGGLREYVQAVEQLGYTHILAYDHVAGADLANRPGWRRPYHLGSMFHEPLVLFGYMAGISATLEFATGIVILPQRQTVLVAKQAAEIDVLSGGRLRLGVGIGWNQVEYQALGMSFTDRGRRSEEQIQVMRLLWTTPSVSFKGRWHSIPEAGINPLPVQRPIPVWMGGGTDATGQAVVDRVVRRIARLADGWMPQFQPDENGQALLERMQGYAREFGRNVSDIGLEGRMNARLDGEDGWASTIEAWQGIGATHLSVNTMGGQLQGAGDHIKRLERFLDAMPP